MDEAAAIAPPPSPPPRRRAPRALALRAVAWLAAIAVAVLAAGWYALGTQAALDYVLQRAVDSAEGRLTIEGGEGSLLSTVRIARIAWRGDTLDVEAREIALVWSPLDLVSRRFIVQGLGRQAPDVRLQGGEGHAGRTAGEPRAAARGRACATSASSASNGASAAAAAP